MDTNNVELAALAALIGSLFSAVLMPLLKLLYEWWKGTGESAVEREKVGVEKEKTSADINVAFAKEWRELYEGMERKMERTEQKLMVLDTELEAMRRSHQVLRAEKDEVYREKVSLESRVAVLEHEIENLRKAFEFLAETVEPSHPEAVAKARKIMKGVTT